MKVGRNESKRIDIENTRVLSITLVVKNTIAIVFLQQGLMKIPVTVEGAESFDLPYIVWWFVAYGELLGGIGLLIGGLMMYSWWSWIGDIYLHDLVDL